MAKDYYETLGVSKNASKEEIKSAYKKLAKKHHPDVNKDHGSSEKFKEINEAASVLGDDQKRTSYDQFGTADVSGGFGGAEGFGGSDFSDFMGGTEFDFGDIFDQFFGHGGGRRRGSRQRSGSDLRYDLEVSLEEAADTIVKTINIPRLATCSKCGGSGAQSSSGVKVCDTCDGSGVETTTRRTPFGLFQQTTTCSKCRGEGKTIKDPCPACDGSGRVHKTQKIEVEIPAGVETGTKLRVRGEGEAGLQGGQPGDLYVVIHVKEHDIFSRDNDDIYVDVPISFSQACLGADIEVPTLKGKAELKIPQGTQTGTLFKMKGKGLPSLHGYGQGSEFVKVIVQVPDKLSKKQKELLKEFDSESSSEKKGFIKRIFE